MDEFGKTWIKRAHQDMIDNNEHFVNDANFRWYRSREGSRKTSRTCFLRCWSCGRMGHVFRHCSHRRAPVDSESVRKVEKDLREYVNMTFVTRNAHDRMFNDIETELDSIKVIIDGSYHKLEEKINGSSKQDDEKFEDFKKYVDDKMTMRFKEMIDERINDMMFKDSKHDDMIKMIDDKFENIKTGIDGTTKKEFEMKFPENLQFKFKPCADDWHWSGGLSLTTVEGIDEKNIEDENFEKATVDDENFGESTVDDERLQDSAVVSKSFEEEVDDEFDPAETEEVDDEFDPDEAEESMTSSTRLRQRRSMTSSTRLIRRRSMTSSTRMRGRRSMTSSTGLKRERSMTSSTELRRGRSMTSSTRLR